MCYKIIHDFVNIKGHICKKACAIEGSTCEVTGLRIHASHQSSNSGITGQLSVSVSSQSSMTLITHHSQIKWMRCSGGSVMTAVTIVSVDLSLNNDMS